MHPLFIAHLVADFLLQPTVLVKWKQKEISGVVMHAAVHALVMLLLMFPAPPLAIALILGIAALHGVIDLAKIRYQKRHAKDFVKGFAADQLAHFIVILGAIWLFPFSYPQWHAESFQGALIILAFFSFVLGAFHLTRAKILPSQKTASRLVRLLLVAAVFIVFSGSAKLLAASCG